MGSLSDKIKIAYLLVVIFFAIGVFIYLLDNWGLIDLENYVPGLKKEAPRVSIDNEHPTEIEWLRLKKEQERLAEEKLALEEQNLKVDKLKQELAIQEKELKEREEGLKKARELFNQAKENQFEREEMISKMADRLVSMPPDDAVKIVAGWSNADTVDVFRKMEDNAAANGTQSIVPYLLTLMPAERSSVITTLMMDAEAQKIATTKEL